MYIVSGAFVKQLPMLPIHTKQMLNKIYPIDIYIGGRVGSIQMYFDTREIQDEWFIELQNATGNLDIYSFYRIWDSFTLIKDKNESIPFDDCYDQAQSLDLLKDDSGDQKILKG